jgi:hypothetical protein
MEPAVLAMFTMASDLHAGLDIVACGSTLGNLLRFVRQQGKPFRMLVEAFHNTVFFVRRENSPKELIQDVRGYGHSFPEAYTTWDPEVKGSGSHQRLIRYRFGGLNLLVRFEGDGYIPEGKMPSETPSASKLKSEAAQVPSLDKLSISFADKAISSGNTQPNSELKIKRAGDMTNQNLIFDLKTRSIRKKEQATDTLREELPRLWVSQIQQFVLAYHVNGVFEKRNIEIRDVHKEVKAWEEAHNDELSILAALMCRIIESVRSRKDGKLELRYLGSGILEMREQLPEAGETLSPETKSLWMGGTTGKSDANSNHDSGVDWFDDDDDDYTACTESCGYCGHCTY